MEVLLSAVNMVKLKPQTKPSEGVGWDVRSAGDIWDKSIVERRVQTKTNRSYSNCDGYIFAWSRRQVCFSDAWLWEKLLMNMEEGKK